jgi:hypothetical protein
MKTFVTAVVLFVGLTGFSFGGDCTNGFCNRPSGRVLSVTKTVTREVVRLPRRVVTGCTNGKCSSRSVTRVR